MPKPKRASKKPKLRLQTVAQETPKPSDLHEFIVEANQVQNLVNHEGWKILERDLTEFRNGIMDKLPYVNPSKPIHYEACILAIAVDKIFSLVNDYSENREHAIDMLNKMENPDLATTMDVDNEL